MIKRKRITELTGRGVPVVLVAFLWIGLWMMWPDSKLPASQPRSKPFRVAYASSSPTSGPVEDPALFAFDSHVSFGPESSGFTELLRMPGMQRGKQRFLAISDDVLNARTTSAVSGWSVWAKKDTGFRSVWDDASLFTTREVSPQMLLHLTANLKDAGFEVPVFVDDEVLKRLPGWEARVMVDLDKEGIPKHVIIEKGSGNRDIDAVICRQILLGRAVSKEVIKGGRVTVSYGSE